jgi:hypothetical protein
MTREKWLECLFDFYMHKPSFRTDGGCVFGYQIEQAWYSRSNECRFCERQFRFRKGHCASVEDDWFRKRIANILRKEGYID